MHEKKKRNRYSVKEEKKMEWSRSECEKRREDEHEGIEKKLPIIRK